MNRILGIVGPTGIGKSQVALDLAGRISAEIVVVDSMQVYRGMDIGTGKPSPLDRAQVRHHGLDLVEPEEEFDVARFLREVTPAIHAIQARGNQVILVGGTGLYIRVLLDGLCQAPGKDRFLRQRLFTQAQQEGCEPLYQKLREVDPASAQRIHASDARRIVRALEVFLLTGKPLTVWHRQTTRPGGLRLATSLVGLICDRDRLYRRIEERIDAWLASGWLEEAKGLHRRALSQTAREALGYGELFDFLEGKTDWQTTVRLLKRNTRRYAKRQISWFKADPRVRWIETNGKSPQEVSEEILRKVAWEDGAGISC